MHGSKHSLLEVCAASLGKALSLRDSNVWDRSCCGGPPTPCPQAVVERAWHLDGSMVGHSLGNYKHCSTHYIRSDTRNVCWVPDSQHGDKSSHNKYSYTHDNNNYHLLRTHCVLGTVILHRHLHLHISFNPHNNPTKLYWYSLEENEAWGDKETCPWPHSKDRPYLLARIWIRGLRL